MKYETKQCRGCWIPSQTDQKVHFYDVKVALGSWDEIEDAEDDGIFFYMDDTPLEVGTIISDGFIITDIYED